MDCNQLKGQHLNTVLCISSNIEGKIATGAEEGELCIWAKHGTALRKFSLADDVTSLCFSNKNPNQLFAAVGENISVFDISKDLTIPEEEFSFNSEEVNQIVLNDKEELLASCDDSGEVKVISLQEKRLFKTLRKHSGICSCVVFRPKRPWELLSAGLDCRIFRCDFSRGKSLQIINCQEVVVDCELSGYMVNPPLVHTIDFSPDTKLFACGIENGQIHVYDSSKKNLSLTLILKGHKRGVSQVHFPKILGLETCLVSGGNDETVCVWDLANRVATAPELSTITPQKVISHGSKVNWLHCTVMEQGPCILVSDLTSDVTIYKI